MVPPTEQSWNNIFLELKKFYSLKDLLPEGVFVYQ